MKSFLLRSLLFLCGVGILNIIIAAGIAWPTYYTPYLELFRRGNETSYRAVLLADSHGNAIPQTELSPEAILNLSTGSDSYRDMYHKLLHLLRNEYEFEAIVLSVDDHTLSSYRETSDNFDRSVLLAPINAVVEGTDGGITDVVQRKYVWPYVPLLSPVHSQFTRRWIVRTVRALSSQNGDRHDEEPAWHQLATGERRKRAMDRMQTQFGGGSSQYLTEYLDLLIREARRHNIVVIGVRLPLSPMYLSILGDTSYGAKEQLSASGYPVIDLKRRFDSNPEMFDDQDHLSEDGARIVARELGSAVQDILSR